MLLKITPIEADSTPICAVKLSFFYLFVSICQIFFKKVIFYAYTDTLNQLIALNVLHTPDILLIVGDFNVDINSTGNYQDKLKSFMQYHDLISCHHSVNCDINYTFQNKRTSSKSFIDCFMFNCPIPTKTGYNLLNDGDNLSDHLMNNKYCSIVCCTTLK